MSGAVSCGTMMLTCAFAFTALAGLWSVALPAPTAPAATLAAPVRAASVAVRATAVRVALAAVATTRRVPPAPTSPASVALAAVRPPSKRAWLLRERAAGYSDGGRAAAAACVLPWHGLASAVLPRIMMPW